MRRKKSRLPLLKLPIINIQQILSNLDNFDLVDFSLCSTKSKNLVKSLKKQFCAADLDVSGASIYLKFRSINPAFGVEFRWCFEAGTYGTPRMKRMIRGIVTNIRKSYPTRSIISRTQNLSTSIGPICEYLCEIFKCPMRKISIDSSRLEGLGRVLRAFRSCEILELHVGREEVPDDDLRYALQNISVSKKSIIDIRPNVNFRCPNVTFECDEWVNHNAYWISRRTFLNSNCAHIHLENSVLIGPGCLTEFIDKWMNSDDKRVKSVEISKVLREVNLEKWQVTPWSPNRRGRYYPVPSTSRRCHRDEWKAIDCSNGIDITRSDGLIATIMSTSDRFFFCVWHVPFPNVDDLETIDLFN